MKIKHVLCALPMALCSSLAHAGTATFNFANVGNSYLAFLPGDSPLVGKEVVSAKVYLDVESFAGSDAANFFTDIAFPIAPLDGNDGGLALLGEDLGWFGAGEFHYFEETERFNGHFVSTRYGAESPGQDFDGAILDGSRIEFTYVPEPAGLALLAVGMLAGLFLRIHHGVTETRSGEFGFLGPSVDENTFGERPNIG